MESSISIRESCLANAPTVGSALAEEVRQVREEKEKILSLLRKLEAEQVDSTLPVSSSKNNSAEH